MTEKPKKIYLHPRICVRCAEYKLSKSEFKRLANKYKFDPHPCHDCNTEIGMNQWQQLLFGFNARG